MTAQTREPFMQREASIMNPTIEQTRAAASVDRTIQLLATGATPGEACTPDLAKGPWEFDGGPAAYGPGSSMGDVIPTGSPRQGALPEGTAPRRTTSCTRASAPRRRRSATGVVILGHFYQRDEVIQHADFVGDSFQLANAALNRPDAEAIVFCGVHFMAETADLLSTPEQAVILPNLAAGCSMADMADDRSSRSAGSSSRTSTAT